MTQDCWGSATNHFISRWFADAILRGIEVGCITHKDLHHGTDEMIWQKLNNHDDKIITKKMNMAIHAPKHFSMVTPEKADQILKCKFRGIDPWLTAPYG